MALSKESLEESLGSNSQYYEQYREKFNEQGFFVSFNWLVLFFTMPFALYRKRYALVIFNFFFFVAFAWLYFENRDNHYINLVAILALLVGLIFFINLLFSMATNYFILKDSLVHKKRLKMSMKGVVFLTLLVTFPLWMVVYDVGQNINEDFDRIAISKITPEKSVKEVQAILNGVSARNLDLLYSFSNRKVLSQVVCLKDVSLLESLKNRGFDFGAKQNFVSGNQIINYAIEKECYDAKVTKFILENANYKTIKIHDTLHKTIGINNYPAFKQLLGYIKLNTDGQDLFGTLYEYRYAVKEDHSKYLKALLKVVPVNQKYYHHGFRREMSAMLTALHYKDKGLAEQLLKKGTNVNWEYKGVGNYYHNHLTEVIENKQGYHQSNTWLEMIELLMVSGFDVNQKHPKYPHYENMFDYFAGYYPFSDLDNETERVVDLFVKKSEVIGGSALRLLARHNKVNQQVIEKLSKKISVKDMERAVYGSCKGDLRLVRFILDKKIEVTKRDMKILDEVFRGYKYCVNNSKLKELLENYEK